MTSDHGQDKTIKKQSITMSTILGKAIEAVVGYIALWFFRPVWERLVRLFNKKDESDS